MPSTRSFELLGPELSSDDQRARIAASDMVIAGRYHPAVFSLSAGVPLVCIAYEHKASGVMDLAGMSELTLALDDVDAETLCALVDRVMAHRQELREQILAVEPDLRERARRTARSCARLLAAPDEPGPGSGHTLSVVPPPP